MIDLKIWAKRKRGKYHERNKEFKRDESIKRIRRFEIKKDRGRERGGTKRERQTARQRERERKREREKERGGE